jgi:hypothetical protein
MKSVILPSDLTQSKDVRDKTTEERANTGDNPLLAIWPVERIPDVAGDEDEMGAWDGGKKTQSCSLRSVPINPNRFWWRGCKVSSARGCLLLQVPHLVAIGRNQGAGCRR